MSPIATGLVHMELNRGDGSLGTFLACRNGPDPDRVHPSQAQLHIVRHGGHLFLLDNAAEMAGLVAAFLSGDNRPSHPLTDPST